MEHGNWFLFSLLLVVVLGIVVTILTARSGRELFLRRIPGLSAIDEAVGRATEMGRPILFSIGLQGLTIDTLQALAVVQHVARLAARYGNRMVLPICHPVVLPVAEELTREAWQAEGKVDAYRPDDVRFLSDQQWAYVAGVIGMINRERVASVFYFGYFYAEALLLAESAQEVGAIQVAGTPATTQIPFFLVTCDYTVIGDEFYAASAYLTREPTLLGSLVGQDIGKTVLMALAVAGTVLANAYWPLANKIVGLLRGFGL
ncbi:hypothetical protein AMK68_03815 [candidate division KD3-62 bacterium DG_56]|uniref:DUF6754 domain-containing protein n=1 Tax=candidate division KD3-62 bacterium DG_56 TaxID=1704032 RepID=A0A0S7XM30_9BACT|nr:MAG: hypothetical protein AMK68_03815 [candidate division KD3-62 bacterium DG_56]